MIVVSFLLIFLSSSTPAKVSVSSRKVSVSSPFFLKVSVSSPDSRYMVYSILQVQLKNLEPQLDFCAAGIQRCAVVPASNFCLVSHKKLCCRGAAEVLQRCCSVCVKSSSSDERSLCVAVSIRVCMVYGVCRVYIKKSS